MYAVRSKEESKRASTSAGYFSSTTSNNGYVTKYSSINVKLNSGMNSKLSRPRT